MALIEKVIDYISAHEEDYVKALSESVSIKSVSSDKKMRSECVKMVKWTESLLQKLGAKTQLRDVGDQTLPDGDIIKLPPVLLADLGNDPKKATLLIYGHLDVQPALKSDGWDTEPFEMTEINGNMYGRGSTDDKGPVLGWIHAIEAMQKCGMEVPLNLKFVLECMEESGSEGLEELLKSEKGKWLSGVDFNVISDNYWIGTQKPCLTYGLRGISYYQLEVKCAKKDLHSGVFGGTVPEAMTDLIYIMSKLVDVNGNILVPGVNETVKEMSAEEESCYPGIDMCVDEYRESVGCKRLLFDKKIDILQHRWRYPSLSLHGIEGAFYESGSKTVIPAKPIGKFSIRLVPDMEPDDIDKKVSDYIHKLQQESGSPNEIRVIGGHSGKPWLNEPWNCPNFKAAEIATEKVWNIKPDYTREGGSIPVTLVIQDTTNAAVLLLPMGQGDDGAHSQNEKLRRKNYIEGTKTMAYYLNELAVLAPKK